MYICTKCGFCARYSTHVDIVLDTVYTHVSSVLHIVNTTRDSRRTIVEEQAQKHTHIIVEEGYRQNALSRFSEVL